MRSIHVLWIVRSSLFLSKHILFYGFELFLHFEVKCSNNKSMKKMQSNTGSEYLHHRKIKKSLYVAFSLFFSIYSGCAYVCMCKCSGFFQLFSIFFHPHHLRVLFLHFTSFFIFVAFCCSRVTLSPIGYAGRTTLLVIVLCSYFALALPLCSHFFSHCMCAVSLFFTLFSWLYCEFFFCVLLSSSLCIWTM